MATALLCAFAYMVLIGGTGRGEVDFAPRLLNGLVGGVLIALYIVRAPSHFDAVDRGVLVALLLFAGAGVLSAFPRQSFDAVLAALAFAAAFYLARDELRARIPRQRLVAVLIGLSAILTVHHRREVAGPDPRVVGRDRLAGHSPSQLRAQWIPVGPPP